MKHKILELAEFGSCRLVLLGLLCRDCGQPHDWMLVYQSPCAPRLDIVSDVIRKTGGRFSHVSDQVGIHYESSQEARKGFEMLLDDLLNGAGVITAGTFRNTN